MNKCVNFEIAKYLKQIGFNDTVTRRYNYLGNLSKYTQFPENYNTEIWGDEISAPTIAEVVMWLYEKHGIWINVNYNPKHKIWDYNYDNINWTKEEFDNKLKQDVDKILENIFNSKTKFNSPIEAYEAAINYCLINLI